MKQQLISFFILSLTFSVPAQNWPQWRGPTDNLIAEAGIYPSKFDAEKDLLWKAALPGRGGSTPAVWDNRIIITCGVGEGDEGLDGALCYDFAGKLLWQTTFGRQRKGKHRRGSGSCPSPVTDGRHIFVYYKSGTLAALDFEGKIIWQKNIQEVYGEDKLWWDLGTSPVLVDNKLIIAVMHEENSYMVAFKADSGKEIWKVDRNFNCPKESHQSYTTPLVYRKDGTTTLILFGADHLTGHDVATGRQIWQCGGFNPESKQYWRVIASPAVTDNIAVVPYGREEYMAGVKLGASGDITDTARIWTKTGIGTDATTPVAKDGKVYFVNYKGKMSCLDAASGKEYWSTKLPEGKGMYYSSPVLAGDKLYVCREKGTIYVYQVSEKGTELLHQTEFMDDFFVATPVLVQGRLIMRGETNLYCVGTNQ